MADKVHTNKCYCDIPRDKLAQLVQQHYIQHVPTTEMMRCAKSDGEREDIAVVALLDVPREELVKLLTLENPAKMPHWLECHKYIRQQLAEEGLCLKGVTPTDPGPAQST
ncbi:MAG: hypothetical protein MOGMAGMI_01434 [Candidatus Omnitrophica bacterium]|nr:hypothetical protein [Candidatus Omnitrophota bacterium]